MDHSFGRIGTKIKVKRVEFLSFSQTPNLPEVSRHMSESDVCPYGVEDSNLTLLNRCKLTESKLGPGKGVGCAKRLQRNGGYKKCIIYLRELSNL